MHKSKLQYIASIATITLEIKAFISQNNLIHILRLQK